MTKEDSVLGPRCGKLETQGRMRGDSIPFGRNNKAAVMGLSKKGRRVLKGAFVVSGTGKNDACELELRCAGYGRVGI